VERDCVGSENILSDGRPKGTLDIQVCHLSYPTDQYYNRHSQRQNQQIFSNILNFVGGTTLNLTPEQQHRKDRILTMMDLEDWVYGSEGEPKPMRDGSLARFSNRIIERDRLFWDWKEAISHN
jgi:hypothetical protein